MIGFFYPSAPLLVDCKIPVYCINAATNEIWGGLRNNGASMKSFLPFTSLVGFLASKLGTFLSPEHSISTYMNSLSFDTYISTQFI